MNQKGISTLIILLLGALIIISIGGAYYLGQRSQSAMPAPQSSATQVDNSTNDVLAELQDYPIYPNSKFVKKEDVGLYKSTRCEGTPWPEPLCGQQTVRYKFISSDDGDAILNWYRENTVQDGWQYGGGAGGYSGPRDFATDFSLTRGDQFVKGYVHATQLQTEFTIEILAKPSI